MFSDLVAQLVIIRCIRSTQNVNRFHFGLKLSEISRLVRSLSFVRQSALIYVRKKNNKLVCLVWLVLTNFFLFVVVRKQQQRNEQQLNCIYILYIHFSPFFSLALVFASPLLATIITH